MKNLKNKNKLNIFIVPFLISNQLFLSAYSNEYLLVKENESDGKILIDKAIEIDPEIEEIINKIDDDFSNIDAKEIDPELYNDDLNKSSKNQKNKNKKVNTINSMDINPKAKEKKYELTKKYVPNPSGDKITTGQFEIPVRGYVKLKEQKISLNLVDSDAIEALKLIAKLGNYGVVILENNKIEEDDSQKINNFITVNFNEIDISDVFNSILMASNLQAKIEKNIIFIGENIFTKSLSPNISKTYRINQANAASVADYLGSLGARISKVFVKGSSNDGAETTDRLKQADLKEGFISSYGNEGGPLNGLIGTVDLRLQTITLIGQEEIIKTAQKYIKAMDLRHRQVALNIQIIDVNLTKTDIKDNFLEFRKGDFRVIGNKGLAIATTNTTPGVPKAGSTVESQGGVAEGIFANWLMAKLTNDQAKVMASPTLILGENNDPNISGAAAVDDTLGTATIGRPFSNEGFIKVGETVITKFSVTTDDNGNVTCDPTEGTAGITFGAKVDKIDDNGYVTFALSPAISSVTGILEINGCGTQSTLSVRKLDTGSIRVKNNDTLVLTGVIKDEDTISTTKVPILGDLPIFGSLFRNSNEISKKSELIILVTPNIIKDDLSEGYDI